MHTIGLVKGRVDAPAGGEDWYTVVLYTTAGDLTGGSLRIVDPQLLTFSGWPVEQALAFVASSGGTSHELDREKSTSPAPTG